MNILDKIVIDKRKEVNLKKELIPIQALRAITLFWNENNVTFKKVKSEQLWYHCRIQT